MDGRKGALCSVSVDRLDYDCLTGGVDVCVSSLMSAPQPSLFMPLPLWATQLQAGPSFVDANPADTLVLHSQLIKRQMEELIPAAQALGCSELRSIRSIWFA